MKLIVPAYRCELTTLVRKIINLITYLYLMCSPLLVKRIYAQCEVGYTKGAAVM